MVFQDEAAPPMSRKTERKEMQGLNTRLAGVIDKVQTMTINFFFDYKTPSKRLSWWRVC